ncbi:SDR family oxidoreductase [Novosphingobium sp. MMS21-SN21R]|uniref:SDR family NAD(P)-dependent oxidoreductase n=1 Tax=Novosphingobium sp. MMS21-SN21R TaxID=2969298 RepID=UPI002884FACE|nr:SDR family oxidoreductase [Novosphingobium sp. MMS21-SN21R]MDT0509639.1 SDR family oxidoreductase [Novosphingobium sp. MMS21-SN21R]
MSGPASSRTALVVGGSGGLGAAICRALASEWGRVAVGYRSGLQAAQDLAAELGGKSATVHCDLSDAASVVSAIAAANTADLPLGAIVFAGGVAIEQPFVSTIAEAQWRQVIEVELIGFTRVVAAAIPVLRASGGGSITAISSVANYTYPPGDALSSVPKAAIESLCRAVAKEEGRSGIRANAVAPGIIDAGLGAQFLADLYSPEVWNVQRQRIALRRFGSAEEIADAAAFLASDRARYITGQTLIVDGGFSL